MKGYTTITPLRPARNEPRPAGRDRPGGRAPDAGGCAWGGSGGVCRRLHRRASGRWPRAALSITAPAARGCSRPGSAPCRYSGTRCDRATDLPVEKKVRFPSTILPRWARRSRSLEALLPVLSPARRVPGDGQEALAALLGTAVAGHDLAPHGELDQAFPGTRHQPSNACV